MEHLLRNPMILAAVSAWLTAQVTKTVIDSVVNRRFDMSRLWGDGGMPSGHSATVTAMATMCGLVCGVGSAEFAISLVVALIVCHDAMGVRLETGRQATVLNELMRTHSEEMHRAKLGNVLKELVGHTPIQVAVGIIVGLANGAVLYYIIF